MGATALTSSVNCVMITERLSLELKVAITTGEETHKPGTPKPAQPAAGSGSKSSSDTVDANKPKEKTSETPPNLIGFWRKTREPKKKKTNKKKKKKKGKLRLIHITSQDDGAVHGERVGVAGVFLETTDKFGKEYSRPETVPFTT